VVSEKQVREVLETLYIEFMNELDFEHDLALRGDWQLLIGSVFLLYAVF
jgi:hypothetical protein